MYCACSLHESVVDDRTWLNTGIEGGNAVEFARKGSCTSPSFPGVVCRGCGHVARRAAERYSNVVATDMHGGYRPRRPRRIRRPAPEKGGFLFAFVNSVVALQSASFEACLPHDCLAAPRSLLEVSGYAGRGRAAISLRAPRCNGRRRPCWCRPRGATCLGGSSAWHGRRRGPGEQHARPQSASPAHRTVSCSIRASEERQGRRPGSGAARRRSC